MRFLRTYWTHQVIYTQLQMLLSAGRAHKQLFANTLLTLNVSLVFTAGPTINAALCRPCT